MSALDDHTFALAARAGDLAATDASRAHEAGALADTIAIRALDFLGPIAAGASDFHHGDRSSLCLVLRINNPGRPLVEPHYCAAAAIIDAARRRRMLGASAPALERQAPAVPSRPPQH
jgi:hypothetical protein